MYTANGRMRNAKNERAHTHAHARARTHTRHENGAFYAFTSFLSTLFLPFLVQVVGRAPGL